MDIKIYYGDEKCEKFTVYRSKIWTKKIREFMKGTQRRGGVKKNESTFFKTKECAVWSMVIFFFISLSGPLGGENAIYNIEIYFFSFLGNLITVIFDYQILRKPLKILSL